VPPADRLLKPAEKEGAEPPSRRFFVAQKYLSHRPPSWQCKAEKEAAFYYLDLILR